jgi:glycosyltransferase domain-containing protein
MAGLQVSIVIPTKERPFFLSKVLAYYARQRYRWPILIGDGSGQAGYDANRRIVEALDGRLDITHERYPDISVHATVVELLELVRTPYTAFSGDDDFLVPEHVDRSAQFLDTHPEYAVAGGVAAWVSVAGDPVGALRVTDASRGPLRTIDNNLPSRRIVAWAYPLRSINTFSVQRTQQMRFGWREAARLGLDSPGRVDTPLYEVCFNVLSLIQGKQVCLSGLYHVMPRHVYKHPGVSAFDRMAGWNWPKQIGGMVACWAEEIVKREEIEYDKAHAVAKAVFLSWLIPYITRYRDNRLRENGLLREVALSRRPIREVIGAIPGARRIARALRGIAARDEVSLESFLSPRSPYHADFMPIYRILTEGVGIP